MKKLISLFAAVYFAIASFVIPYLFLTYTECTGANMFGMCSFFAMSVFGCYAYTDTFIQLRKK